MSNASPTLRLAVTGYVSEQAGSVASANALLLKALLERGCEVVFFSKASFVDPRPAVGGSPRFRFVDTDNRFFDRLRTRLARIPLIGFLAGQADNITYNRLLVKTIQREQARQPFDLVLWLGEFAQGRIPGVATVSYIQGPPGTDARSILNRFDEILSLAGKRLAWRWRLLAELRLSAFGLPPLRATDHFIVGSNQSRQTLQRRYGIAEKAISVLPYPIDLDLFSPSQKVPCPSLRALWLGRIIPRKRLDLFLDGAAEAIRRGVDLRLTLIGGIGFIPGYEGLIARFPFPERLTWKPSVPREEVPALMACHDLLAQPSDEENFGSSVAEAQACGLPVIVGQTNGNADYLCERDLHLADDRPETLADAIALIAARTGDDPAPSRECAEEAFSLHRVTSGLLDILQKAGRESGIVAKRLHG